MGCWALRSRAREPTGPGTQKPNLAGSILGQTARFRVRVFPKTLLACNKDRKYPRRWPPAAGSRHRCALKESLGRILRFSGSTEGLTRFPETARLPARRHHATFGRFEMQVSLRRSLPPYAFPSLGKPASAEAQSRQPGLGKPGQGDQAPSLTPKRGQTGPPPPPRGMADSGAPLTAYLMLLHHLAEAGVSLRNPPVELGDPHAHRSATLPAPPDPNKRGPRSALLPAHRADSRAARATEWRAERPTPTIESGAAVDYTLPPSLASAAPRPSTQPPRPRPALAEGLV